MELECATGTQLDELGRYRSRGAVGLPGVKAQGVPRYPSSIRDPYYSVPYCSVPYIGITYLDESGTAMLALGKLFGKECTFVQPSGR